MKIVVIADDLSGATESAAAFLSSGRAPKVWLGSVPADQLRGEVEVLTMSTREAEPEIASQRFTELADRLRAVCELEPVCLVKKVDSLLRGNIAAETAPLLRLTGGFAVAAVALPAQARETAQGRLLVGGTPLEKTDLYRAESRRAPRSIWEVLPPIPNPTPALGRGITAEDVLPEAKAQGALVVADAADAEDLGSICHSAAKLAKPGEPVLLIGTSALCSALLAHPAGREAPETIPGTKDREYATETPDHDEAAFTAGIGAGSALWPLLVVGSASSAAAQQIEVLLAAEEPAGNAAGRVHDVLVTERSSCTTMSATVAKHLLAGPVVLRVDPDAAIDPRRSDALAELVGGIVGGVDILSDLFLAGGETAQRCLDTLGIVNLTPMHEIPPGAVVSTGEYASGSQHAGRIVTRPGSFGGREALLDVLRYLLPPFTPRTTES